jgi:hypothetical protein
MAATPDLNHGPSRFLGGAVAGVIADIGEKASYRFLEYFTTSSKPTIETAPVFHPPEGKAGF